MSAKFGDTVAYHLTDGEKDLFTLNHNGHDYSPAVVAAVNENGTFALKILGAAPGGPIFAQTVREGDGPGEFLTIEAYAAKSAGPTSAPAGEPDAPAAGGDEDPPKGEAGVPDAESPDAPAGDEGPKE